MNNEKLTLQLFTFTSRYDFIIHQLAGTSTELVSQDVTNNGFKKKVNKIDDINYTTSFNYYVSESYISWVATKKM